MEDKQAPFIFGKLAETSDFTDRDQDRERLRTNILNGTGSILISPRRWGKTSLVKNVADEFVRKNKNYRVAYLDLFSLRGEAHFYEQLSKEIIKVTSTKMEELLQTVKKFFKQLTPSLTFSPDTSGDFSLSLDWEEVTKHPDEILDLANNIAKAKKIKLIVCIDEFQNISMFEDPVRFQKMLRAHWQQHQHVTYCLYGSKRHMMMDVFASPAMPFYKFGDIIFLEKIDIKEWVRFIRRRFKATGKKIGADHARRIAELTECHSYYVQQLAQMTWLRTNKTCKDGIVEVAYDTLIDQLSLLFQNLTDSLSRTQVYFLHALLDGVEKLSAKDTLKKYSLGTSANILKIKTALLNREVIDIRSKQIDIIDPMYKGWLRRDYFKYPNPEEPVRRQRQAEKSTIDRRPSVVKNSI